MPARGQATTRPPSEGCTRGKRTTNCRIRSIRLDEELAAESDPIQTRRRLAPTVLESNSRRSEKRIRHAAKGDRSGSRRNPRARGVEQDEVVNTRMRRRV
jgi:hypothetical protein